MALLDGIGLGPAVQANANLGEGAVLLILLERARLLDLLLAVDWGASAS